jgi:hypothetical protein
MTHSTDADMLPHIDRNRLCLYSTSAKTPKDLPSTKQILGEQAESEAEKKCERILSAELSRQNYEEQNRCKDYLRRGENKTDYGWISPELVDLGVGYAYGYCYLTDILDNYIQFGSKSTTLIYGNGLDFSLEPEWTDIVVTPKKLINSRWFPIIGYAWINGENGSYSFGLQDVYNDGNSSYRIELNATTPLYQTGNKIYTRRYILDDTNPMGLKVTEERHTFDFASKPGDPCWDNTSNCTFYVNGSYAYVEFISNGTIDPNLTQSFTTDYPSIDWQLNRTELTDLGVRQDAPVLYMNFNSAPEGTYVQDNSMYNNFGTTSGFDGDEFNSSCSGRTFADDGCYEFDGSDDYVEKTVANWRSSDFEGTISLWFNTKDVDTVQYLFTSADIITNDYFILLGIANLDTNPNIIFGQRNGDASDFVYGDTALQNNQLYHAVVVSNGTGYKLYINGADDGLNLNNDENNGEWFGDTANRDNFVIGALHYNSQYTSHFNGSIDQVQIWDRALSADEILNLYNGTKNNSDYIGKYARDGDFKSLVFYNDTSTYWNTALSLADSDGSAEVYDLCQADENCVSYWDLVPL